MGNQQMLPLLLAAVIVGLALVRGLVMIAETNKQDRETQIQQVLLDTAERAQVWYRKPATLGGGGRAFSQISWRKLNLNADTPIGNFTMSKKTKDSFHLTGQSVDDPSILLSYVVYADSVVFQKSK